MNRFLSHNEIEYVIYHLYHHIHIPVDLRNRFIYSQQNAPTKNTQPSVVFRLSEKALDENAILWIGELPVLFPLSTTKEFYYIDNSGNLVFNHDIVKSIFYLLSGYQEFEKPGATDKLGRFSFEYSIQKKLGIVTKPIVNYYFMIIAEAITQFASRNSISVSSRRLFKNFGFLLSHDIDYVDTFNFKFFGYKFKEILRIVPSRLSFTQNVRLAFTGLISLLKKENPYWNFTRLRAFERSCNFKSTFYFLDQGVKNSDADYGFEEPRLLDLFKYLIDEGCEIGLHGPVRSVSRLDVMKSSVQRLTAASKTHITGSRQHRLLWEHPLTAKVLQEAGLKYDTTLGFAAHEGFRNSYCLPFRLYDFHENKMMHLWEFPLNVMDVTLFAYQNYSSVAALEQCMGLQAEAVKFGGIFSVLWHNSFFDETTYPGITEFYQTLLSKLAVEQAENILGSELVNKMVKYSNDL